MNRRVVLVVEDGTEYADAFARLAPDGRDVEWIRAPDAAEARRILEGRRVDAVFIDLVFDRTPPEALCGDLDREARRFAGDRARALDHLVRQQGFYVLGDIAPWIAPGMPVLLAHDFEAEAGRLAALREKIPGLEGMDSAGGLGRVLERLLRD